MLRAALLPVLLGTGLLLSGCGEGTEAGPRTVALSAPESASSFADRARPPVHVDSVFPIEEEIRRFREGLEKVSTLRGGADSQDALMEGLIAALESADTASVATMALDRREFAWLYYPHTIYVARPYELAPSLVWYQLQNRSSRGLTRLLRRYSGETLYYSGYDCPDEGEHFGDGHIWHGCTVKGELPGGEIVEERLFGSILELDGQFKFVSFTNEL